MRCKRLRRVLGSGIILSLAPVGMLLSAPAAGASATPTMIVKTTTTTCVDTAQKGCTQSLATIPAKAQLQVICSRGGDYYVEDLADRAYEGYVPKAHVSNAPGGLVDCDTTAHPAIYAAANALGDVGKPVDPLACLTFVIDAWKGAGVSTIPGSDDPVTWWPANYKKFGWAWDTPGMARFTTPPRGALVFWYGTNKYPQYDSEDGHVAISIGNGWVVSTEQGNSGQDVHLVTIAQVTQQAGGSGSGPGSGTEMGWVMPINGYQIQP